MRAMGGLCLMFSFLALSSARSLSQTAKDAPKPDFVVSDFTREGDAIVIEVQNQGPGTAKSGEIAATVSWNITKATTVRNPRKGKAGSETPAYRFKVPVPSAPFATETVTLSLKKMGVKPDEQLGILEVKLDVNQAFAEEREGNNSFYKHLQGTRENNSDSKLVGQPERGDYKSGVELPDLAITDIVRQGPHLKIRYENRGKGATGADFSISVKAGKFSMDGNPYYRIKVPGPGVGVTSGGFAYLPNSHGLKAGDEVEVEAVIDVEDRVLETDKKNNAFKKKIRIE